MMWAPRARRGPRIGRPDRLAALAALQARQESETPPKGRRTSLSLSFFNAFRRSHFYSSESAYCVSFLNRMPCGSYFPQSLLLRSGR